MKKTNQTDRAKNVYDDGNIPEIDLSQNKSQYENVEPLPESFSPRRDGPGGDDFTTLCIFCVWKKHCMMPIFFFISVFN